MPLLLNCLLDKWHWQHWEIATRVFFSSQTVFSSYSVHVADSVCQSDPVEVKRRKLGLYRLKQKYLCHILTSMWHLCWLLFPFCLIDIVISFVKKTVAGVAGLLRLRNPLTTRYEEPRHCEDTQVCTLSTSYKLIGKC